MNGDGDTHLVNVKKHGREGVTMIGRSTQFGNPFRLKKDGGGYTRDGSVKAYREWFYEKINSDDEFRDAVESLRGETLGCYCKPKACHGDVILGYLQSLHTGSDRTVIGDGGGRPGLVGRCPECGDIQAFPSVRTLPLSAVCAGCGDIVDLKHVGEGEFVGNKLYDPQDFEPVEE